jgi:hypothetical protein
VRHDLVDVLRRVLSVVRRSSSSTKHIRRSIQVPQEKTNSEESKDEARGESQPLPIELEGRRGAYVDFSADIVVLRAALEGKMERQRRARDMQVGGKRGRGGTVDRLGKHAEGGLRGC